MPVYVAEDDEVDSVIHIKSNVSNAEVYLNGVYKGKTSVTLKNLRPGKYRLELRKRFYECDDFTILMASSMLAIGGNACINTASQGESGHAFAEVDVSRFNLEDVESIVRDYFGSSISMPDHLYFRKDGNSVWLNLDWQTMFPGGKYWLDTNYDRWDSYTRFGWYFGKWRRLLNTYYPKYLWLS